jgi:acetoin utilization deacetylase AcuC-like enzyme
MATGFFWDELCFWHGGGNYALTVPVGGFVQPLPAGLPENPETKRRLVNLMNISGLARELAMQSAPPATRAQMARIHPDAYLNRFKEMSDAGGGELGRRTPFGHGGFEQAAQSAGLAIGALDAVLSGQLNNAYALSRPPGHHCLPDFPNGFCLLNNIGIALENARAQGLAQRAAILDWDVHHGNGSEQIYIDRSDTYTISLHQDCNYPMDTGGFEVRGQGAGLGTNLNIPLPPGAGHVSYLEAVDRIVVPEIAKFDPDVIIVACGFDASCLDPLSRMMATSETFRQMTRKVKELAHRVCKGRLVLVHEGGYSEVHVPFCGHAVLEELSGSTVHVPDPLEETLSARQPKERMNSMVSGLIDEYVDALQIAPAP